MSKTTVVIYHSDLIEASNERLKWMEKEYGERVAKHKMPEEKAQRAIQIQKRILRILKKYKHAVNPGKEIEEDC
jgi:hypothetical protein